MATTVERPNKIDERTPAAGGGSGHGGFFTEDGNLYLVLDRRSPHPSSTAVYVALAGIGMIFAALTSALVVRKGGATDWKSFTLPSILYVNTLVLLASGFVLEIGRRAVGRFMTAPDHQHAKQRSGFISLWDWDWCSSPDNTLRGCNFGVKACISRRTRAVRSSTCLRSRMPYTCWVDLGTGAHHHAATAPYVTEEHVECGFAILAFHGCLVDLPVVFALVHYLTG